jgi:hypothetical protein
LNQLLIEEPNNSDVVKQILLNAGISPIIVLGYVCVYKINVKKPKSRGGNQQGLESYLLSKLLRD